MSKRMEICLQVRRHHELVELRIGDSYIRMSPEYAREAGRALLRIAEPDDRVRVIVSVDATLEDERLVSFRRLLQGALHHEDVYVLPVRRYWQGPFDLRIEPRVSDEQERSIESLVREAWGTAHLA